MLERNAIYLTQPELAVRFRVSPRTLERWRWLKTGPNYTKLGGKVVYAITDVEAYERRRRAETHSSILGSWR
jgi:helix-turn-helix protein